MNEKVTLSRLISSANTKVIHKSVISNVMSDEEKKREVSIVTSQIAKSAKKNNVVAIIVSI